MKPSAVCPMLEVVLVEDNADDEMMSLRGIARSGIPCNVTVRRDGATAIELLLSPGQSPPNFIVLDYKLPIYSGKEILCRIRDNETTRFVPVVIFSGTNAGPDLEDCYRGGANSCVMKPDDPAEYIDKLALVARYWLTVNHGCDRNALTSTRRSIEA